MPLFPRTVIAYIQNKELQVWIFVVLLLLIKMYQGDVAFFESHFYNPEIEPELFKWHKWLYHHLASLLLWAIVPFVFIKTWLGENLSSYGWQAGDWKFGLKATLVAILILPLPVYVSSLDPEHLAFYPLTTLATASAFNFFLWGLSYLPHYIGWEFFFRGFIGIGFKKYYGAIGATAIQVSMTVLLHLDKPIAETWGAAFGGIYLGWLTYRTESVWYAILFHFYLGMLNTYMCS